MHNVPGPGDPETWPAYTGHPNDPRNDEAGEHATDCDYHYAGVLSDCSCGTYQADYEPDYEAMSESDEAYAPYDIYG